MAKTRHKEARKRHHHNVSSLDGSNDSDDNDNPTHKGPRVTSHHSFVQSSTEPSHRHNNEVSAPDEEEMKRNSKGLQWESDGNNCNKDGIDDEEDNDFKELAQELNKENR